MTTSSHNIGFISTRFAGTDGVSLETQKWVTVLERLGHQCFYFAGECDRNSDQSHVVPEAFYRHPDIDKINQQAYSGSWTVTKEAREAHPEIATLHKDFFSMYVRPPQMTRRHRPQRPNWHRRKPASGRCWPNRPRPRLGRSYRC